MADGISRALTQVAGAYRRLIRRRITVGGGGDGFGRDEPDVLLCQVVQTRRLVDLRDLLRSDPRLLSVDIEKRLAEELARASDPQIQRHLDRLLYLISRCRRYGVDQVFDELIPLADVLTRERESRPSPSGGEQGQSADLPGLAPPELPQDIECDRAIEPSADARRMLRKYSERTYFRPMIDLVEQAGQDTWLRALLVQLGEAVDATSFYEGQLTKHSQGASEALRAFSAVSRIDFTRIPVEWLRLDSPNALSVRGRHDPGMAIGVDITLISQLNTLALAGLDASRRRNDDIVLSAANGLAALRFGGEIDPMYEPRDLALMRRSGDLMKLYRGMGDTAFRFVLGHELGHIALGHLETAPQLRLTLVPEEGESDVSWFPNHQIEYEADRWSAEHLLLVARSGNGLMDVILAHTVPAIYFACTELLYAHAVPKSEPGSTAAATHPPPRNRSRQLQADGSIAAKLRSAAQFEVLLDLPDYLLKLAEHVRSGRAGS